jgi:hypothetical protein
MNNSIYLEKIMGDANLFATIENQVKIDIVVVITAQNQRAISKTIKSLAACNEKENTLILVVLNDTQENVQKIYLTESSSDINIVFSAFGNTYASDISILSYGLKLATDFFKDSHKDGVIISLDSVAICDENFFSSIRTFHSDKSINAGNVQFEYQLNGPNYDTIVNYELFLRYYTNALRWAGMPNALYFPFCISMRASSLTNTNENLTQKTLLNSLIQKGGIGEINDTCVTIADRKFDANLHNTPNFMSDVDAPFDVYNPMIFVELRTFIDQLKNLYKCSSTSEMAFNAKCAAFLESENFESAFQNIREKTSNYGDFEKFFFEWFDQTRVLAFVHFFRDKYFQNIDIIDALGWLHQHHTAIPNFGGSKEVKLMALRAFDEKADFWVL